MNVPLPAHYYLSQAAFIAWLFVARLLIAI